MMTAASRERETQEALNFLFGSSLPDGPQPRSRNAFPAYRVFLYGFEVTDDVTSINIKNHVGKQPNSCSVSLLNERDKYLMTTEDVFFITGIDPSLAQIRSRDLGQIPIGEDLASLARTRAAQDANRGSPESVTLDYRLSNSESVKSKIFSIKQAHDKIEYAILDARGFVTGRESRSRYPFLDGLPVFHPNDPLRVFVRDVFKPSLWYYGFSGLITDISDDASVNNQKVLNIAAEDPTKLLRHARVFSNPGITTDDTRTVADVAEFNAFGNVLHDKTLVTIVDFIVFGGQREPVFETLLIAPAGISEDDAQRRAIEAGRVDAVDVTRYTATSTIEQIRATLTQAQRAQLDQYIATRSQDLKKLQQLQLEAFTIDYLNRFGDRVPRRYGLSGVGAFKPAREVDRVALRRQVEQEIQTIRATALVPSNDGTSITADGERTAEADTARQPTVSEVSRRRTEQARRALESPYIGAHVYGLSLADQDPFPDGTESVTLPQWEGIISWQVRVTDVQDLLNKDVDPASFNAKLEQRLHKAFGEATIEDIITLIGEDPVNFPVDGGRVFMLLPSGAEEIGNDVVGLDLIQSASMKDESSTQNLLQLLYDALDRIEFKFYCTPKGDLVVEFPLYDFDPDDFGVYEPNYIVELDDQFASSATLSDAAVRTIIAVTASPTRYTQEGRRITSVMRDAAVVKVPALFPIYGQRMERADMKGRLRTTEAAQLYANILLNRLNADAYSAGLPIVPRFNCGLNRPYLWKLRNHIGTSADVTHSMAWNGGWRTSIGVHYMRGWSGQMTSDHKMIYVPIAGAASRPINYKVLFGAAPDPVTPDLNTQDGTRTTHLMSLPRFDDQLREIEDGDITL
jgi:hypothetical protein